MWNPIIQKWENVEANSQSTSKVTFDFKFSNWHNGEKMDMNDILHSLYFTVEWGTKTDENDKTFDTEFTPRAAQSIQTIKGINQIDEDTIEADLVGGRLTINGRATEIPSERDQSYRDMHVAAMRGTSPACSLPEALGVVHLIDASERALRTKTWVSP